MLGHLDFGLRNHHPKAAKDSTSGIMRVQWFILLVILHYCRCRTSVTVPSTSGSGKVGSEASLSDEEPADAHETAEPLSQLELKLARLHQGIRSRLNAVTNGDEVFRIAEDIPAITRCTDKAISIGSADKEDAEDAVLAIQRLASLSVESNNWALTTNDRRFEQLSDCVELGLSDISSMELCKYLWSISVLGLSDEDRARAVFGEYLARIEAPDKNLSEGEVATMMWTVGCVKNNFGWTDNRLMAKLTDLLLEEPLESLNRGGRLLVRILWTLTVHKDSIDSFACRRLGQKVLHMLDIGSRQDDLSTHHISTIILAGASLHVMREEAAEQLVDFFSQALSILKDRITEENLAVSELGLAASALTELYDELQYLERRQKVSSTAADEATRRHAQSMIMSKQLDGLLEEVRGAAESLLSSGLLKMSQLDIDSCASLMKIVVTVLPRGELSTDFVEAAASRLEVFVESWHAQHYCWSPTDAASLLESVARMTWSMRGQGPSGLASSIGVHGKDRLGVQLMQEKHRRSTNEQRERSDGDHDTDGDQQWGRFTPFQRWQRLAGICSSICSSQADNINDAPLLVGSAWSCVSYDRPCSLLASEVKRRLPSLEFGEAWGPAHLSHLASVMVSSHGSGTKNGLKDASANSGFEPEHLDRVSAALLPTIKFIPSLSERINAIITFASLVASGSGTATMQDDNHIECASIDFNADKLRDVRSRVLLRFLQSDIPKSEEMDRETRRALRKRKVDPSISYKHLSPVGEHAEQATRLSLLSKLMKDWHHHSTSKGGRRDDRLLGALIDSTKDAIREMLPSCRLKEMEGLRDEDTTRRATEVSTSSGEDADGIIDPLSRSNRVRGHEGERSDSDSYDEQEELWTGADLVALGDALRVIAVHNWKDDELESLVDAVIATAITQCDENNHSSSGHRHLYDIGRVEGSLQLYRLAKHTDTKAFFGFASGVARKYIPKIKEALVSVLGDRGD